MERREALVIVSGRVQGVWFRATTLEVAREAGAKGYVRNLPDGRVEALLQGTREEVEAVIAFMKKGPPGAVVSDIQVTMRVPEREYETFQVTY
ncbi:MAG: acylphosphatase [Deltaproteobacteria bacterium]|nr:acylphosphatase [Deltaproteobacteria bacterium]NIS77840.1 acylphosphatase [Deltaproteobacteria bacterium]